MPDDEVCSRVSAVTRRVHGVKGRITYERYLTEAKVALGDALFQWVLAYSDDFPFETGVVTITWDVGKVTATAGDSA